jgi:hypothetical protein
MKWSQLAFASLALSFVVCCKVEPSETEIDEADARPQTAIDESDPPIKPSDNSEVLGKRQEEWHSIVLDSVSVPACANCHSEKNKLGSLDSDYCNSVLMPSIQSERKEWNAASKKIEVINIHNGKNPPMPPATEDAASFAADIAFIKDRCRSAVENAGAFWSW